MGLQAAMRAACVELMTDFVASGSTTMQVYPGRPKSIHPPTGFVDAIHETLDHSTNLTKRVPVADIVIVHAIFDSRDAADQKDAWTDGFIDWCEERFHAAGPNTMLGITDTADLPNYVPEWMPPDRQLVYYATRITVEGYALIG
jgi:hypothetical protein